MSAALAPRAVEESAQMVQPGARRWAALGLVCFGALMIVLDGTIVNIAHVGRYRELGFQQCIVYWPAEPERSRLGRSRNR